MPRRELPEVNAGSMADIAFTLLIFFLVTTTLATDKGERMPLAPWDSDNDIQDTVKFTDRNVLDVQIREDGSLVLENENFTYEKLASETKRFLTNNGQDPNYSDSYQKAVVNIVYHENAPYGNYVEAYSNIKSAFNDIRNDAALSKHGRTYVQLSESEKEDLREIAKEIRREYPLKIAEKVMDED